MTDWERASVTSPTEHFVVVDPALTSALTCPFINGLDIISFSLFVRKIRAALVARPTKDNVWQVQVVIIVPTRERRGVCICIVWLAFFGGMS